MGDKPLPAVPDRVNALTTEPFPSAYSLSLSPGGKLQTALTQAVNEGPGSAWRVALALIDLSSAPHPVGGFRETEEHFSASLLKVSSMYAGYELRKRARLVAKELGKTTKKALFADMAAHFNPKITAKIATIAALKKIKPEHRFPAYTTIFDAAPAADGTFDVNFSSVQDTALDRSIHISSNSHAGQTVRHVGYGYLIGCLASAGFFDPATNKGVWLAADYTGVWSKLTIDTVNDQLVGQATTALDLARLYALVAKRELVDAAHSDEMLAQLAKPASFTPPSEHEVFMDRDSYVSDSFSSNFTVTHTKVGLAGLKKQNSGGRDVYSEGALIVHKPTKKRFAVVWQNAFDEDVGTVIEVVHKTLAKYTSP